MNAPAWPGFDAGSFLREHWQRRPLLIRNPWADWANPLAPDELAGLALEAELESRLVTGRPPGGLELEHGPLAPERFDRLGSDPWTLLVQAVDHHVPAVAALKEPFRFVPDWRLDDVMVSYAVDGGGVGAHFDRYDVFLVQGLGRRRWRVGGRCDESAALLPHPDLRLLAQFEPIEEWVLEPGDILYVPPGVAHEGVALGDDCMTYSIGFRAPSRAQLVSDWADHLLATLDEDDRYTDGALDPLAHPGEITPGAVDRVREMMTEPLADDSALARWFGERATAPGPGALDWTPDAPVPRERIRRVLRAGASLERNAASRFAFVRLAPRAVTLFVDGAAYRCEGAMAVFAERLCAGPRIAIGPEPAPAGDLVELLRDLLDRGCVAIAD